MTKLLEILNLFNNFKKSASYDYGSPGIVMFPEEQFNYLVDQLNVLESEEKIRMSEAVVTYAAWIKSNGQFP